MPRSAVKTPPENDEILSRREGQVRPSSFNEQTREVEIIWAAGADVKRWSWDEGAYIERLSMDPKHIRLDRFKSGMSLMDSHEFHGMDNRLGTVKAGSVRIVAGKAFATVRLSRNAKGEALYQDLLDNHPFPVSVSYKIHRSERTEGSDKSLPILTATDWEALELSAVPVPADAGAHSRADARSPQTAPHNQKRRKATKMPTGHSAAAPEIDDFDEEGSDEQRAEDEQRAAEITAFAKFRKWGPKTTRAALESGLPALEIRAREADREITRRQKTVIFPRSDDRYENPDFRIRAASEALYRRAVPGELSDEARAYYGLTLAELARDCLRNAGDRAIGSGATMVTRALNTTSDYQQILSGATSLVLGGAYRSVPAALKVVARKATVPDFRPKTTVRMSEAADLQLINEHGEFTAGTMLESGNAYQVETFGRLWGATRQLLINDNLGAFNDLPQKFGRAAARLESDLLVKVLQGNTVMGDGSPLFHASHGNLGTAAALSATSLAAGRLAMRKQRDSGGALIDVEPRYLIVPSELEDIARTLVEVSLAPVAVGDVNPNQGRLKVVVEPRLTSPTAWFLAADPAVTPAIEFAHLEGAEEPLVESRAGWNVDGVEWKVRHDFGAGAIDHVGIYKNPGA